MSGKERPLLAAPPLRTVRASFPAYGSSLYKSGLRPNRFPHRQTSSMQLLVTGWV